MGHNRSVSRLIRTGKQDPEAERLKNNYKNVTMREPTPFMMMMACALYFLAHVNATARNPDRFYTEAGENKSFEEIMQSGDLPKGRNSTKGVKGSIVKLNQEMLDDGPNAKREIPNKIFLHTLGHSIIWRRYFPNWSRWYQEDGNTQIFRLFKGETNVRNSRPFAARIEAFSEVEWQQGDWHEWVGTYTILKPHRAIIFQARNNVNDWSMQLNMDGNGNVILNRREGEDEVIAEDMVGKPFHIRVLDNGLDYKVYLDGKEVGVGSYARPKGVTRFRWGLYRGARAMTHDAMILVTGPAIDPQDKEESKKRVPDVAPKVKEAPKKDIPEGLPIAERVWTNREGQKVTSPGIYKPGEDSLWIKAEGKWVPYPLADLSDADRKILTGVGQ